MNTPLTTHYCPKCRRTVAYTVQPSQIDSSPRCPGCLTPTTELARAQTPVIGTPLPGKQEAA